MPRLRFASKYRLPVSPQPQATPDPMVEQFRKNQLLHQQAALTQQQAELARSNNLLSNQIERDKQRHAYYDGAHQLEQEMAQHGIYKGSPQFAHAFAEFSSGFPDARASQDVREHMKDYGAVHDEQAAFQQRLDTLKANGQIPTSGTITKSGDVSMRFKAQQSDGADTEGSDPEAELYKSRGLTKAQFLNPLNAQQGVINNKGDFTTNFNPGQVANAIQFQAGSSKTDEKIPVTHVMPLAEFNNYRQGLGQKPLLAVQYTGPNPTPNGQVAPTPTVAPVQPSPTPDQTPIYTPSPSPESTQTPSIPTANSKDEYDAIPAGAQFMSNGTLFTKPQATPDTGE